MTELASKVLEIMRTAESKSSFSKTEFKEYGISVYDAETALMELESNGLIHNESKYVNGTQSYKLS